jgi:hypothetical protein
MPFTIARIMTTRRRSLAILSTLVSGIALISAQPGDMAGRIRADGQQRSRALALFRTLTDDIGARLVGDVALLGRLPQDPQPPGRYPNLFCFGHGISDSGYEPKQEG